MNRPSTPMDPPAAAPPPAETGLDSRMERLLSALVLKSADTIAVLSPDGRFRYLSPSLTPVLGWLPEELAGANAFQFIHPDDHAAAMTAFGRVLQDPETPVLQLYRLQHKDGRWMPFEGCAVNLQDDPAVGGIVVSSRSLSGRAELWDQLRADRQALADEVGLQTTELLTANERLEREIEERRQVEEQLRRRLAMEQALEQVSRSFVSNEPPNFDRILRLVVESMQVSRGFLHLFGGHLEIEASHEWCVRQEEARIGLFTGIDMSHFGWAFQRLHSDQHVLIQDITELPPEAEAETKLCQLLGSRSVLLVPLLSKDGLLRGLLGVDTTDRPRQWTPEDERILRVISEMLANFDAGRRAEAALRDSEARFRAVFESAAVGMVLGDPEGRMLSCNRAFEGMLGYSLAELQGRHFNDVTHPEDMARADATFEDSIRRGHDSFYIQIRFVRRDGETIWMRASVSLVKDSSGTIRFVIGMFEDATRQQQAQDQLLAYQEQLRNLASQLSLAEEQQRRRIAAELHDRIGQSLAMIKIRLGACREPAIMAGMESHLEEIQSMLDQTIDDTRSLIFEISPPVLYELGFEAAVEWLSEQMLEQHGLRVAYENDRQPKPLDEDVRVVLFQAVRELLVNVIKHARARNAAVSLAREEQRLRVTVRDDGVGFDPEAARSRAGKQGGFGLFNIHERLASIGGSLTVEAAEGRGTRITLRAPLHITGRKGKKTP